MCNQPKLKAGDKITLEVEKVLNSSYYSSHGPTAIVKFKGCGQPQNYIGLDQILQIDSTAEPIKVGDKVKSKINGNTIVDVKAIIDDTWMAVQVPSVTPPQVRKIADYVHAY